MDLNIDKLTPHCHEHRKQHSAIVVKQQAHLRITKLSSEHQTLITPLGCLTLNALTYLGVRAGVRKLPHFATFVTKWTHDRVGLTNLLSMRQ